MISRINCLKKSKLQKSIYSNLSFLEKGKYILFKEKESKPENDENGYIYKRSRWEQCEKDKGEYTSIYSSEAHALHCQKNRSKQKTMKKGKLKIENKQEK